jgi:hypothetical protein
VPPERGAVGQDVRDRPIAAPGVPGYLPPPPGPGVHEAKERMC